MWPPGWHGVLLRRIIPQETVKLLSESFRAGLRNVPSLAGQTGWDLVKASGAEYAGRMLLQKMSRER